MAWFVDNMHALTSKKGNKKKQKKHMTDLFL